MAASKKPKVTNALRILEKAGIPHIAHHYGDGNAISGMEVAKLLNMDPDCIFKTLVTIGKSGEHYVFVIPVNLELSLKKAANAVSEKSIEMIKQKELFPLTGYVHGGCSPIGMKKAFKTTFHTTAQNFDKIFFSAGAIGVQVELSIKDLQTVMEFDLADVAD